MPTRNIIDFYWTSEGDFFVGEEGDFEDTTKHHYRGLIQKVFTHVGSSKGDWPNQPEVGADLEGFRGENNTAETGRRVVEALYSAVISSGALSPNEIIIDAVPLSEERLAVVFLITPSGTSRSINLNFTYDMRDNKVVPR